MANTAIFYYTKAQIVNSSASIIETPLNSIDSTTTSIFSLYAPLVQQNGTDGGSISYTEFIRKISPTESNINWDISMTTPQGNLKFGLVNNTSLFIPNEIYESYATYRTGDYTSSRFPLVQIEVLNDEALTRKFTITY